jgi:error-prone DNA polymerase
MSRYFEFAITSNFSFLRGASHPEELMLQADHVGLAGIGLCDRNSVAGVVRAHLIKREKELALAYHPGARLLFADGTPDILAYPRDRDGWGRLCRLLTRGNLRAEKGECILHLDDLLEHIDGLELVVMETSTWPHSSPPFLKKRNEENLEPSMATPLPTPPPTQVGPARVAQHYGEPGHARVPWGREQAAASGAIIDHSNGVNTDVATTPLTFPPPPEPRPAGVRASLILPEAGEPAAGRGRDREGGQQTRLRLVAKTQKKTDAKTLLGMLREAAPDRVRLAASMLFRGNDRSRLAQRVALARAAGVPLIAVNDVLYHHPDRRRLQDVLTCIREHLTIEQAGRRLAANAERYLKPPAEMARLFRDAPEAIEETARLDAALTFSLDQLRYEYPDELRAGFATPQDALVHLAWQGAVARYPEGIPDNVRQTLDHELALIGNLEYAPYFLTVYDIVRFARSKNILCQGRGSAANSAVCYCLRITDVDPREGRLLFERFISSDRGEPPDIDVDFEHERREEVIQHIYQHYRRDHTGIAATVISYRGRSAIREIGKVFGLSEDTIGALSSSIWGMGGGGVRKDALVRAGIDVESPRMQKMRALAAEIQAFPRHLSQHVGGFVITRSPLDEVVPIGNGAMPDRTFVEWDKDDLDALGILKVDVLGLGMLTCVRKAFELAEQHYGLSFRTLMQTEAGEQNFFSLATIPKEDPAVYRMLQRADSLGVFQVESRAQMSMLPRLKPKEFYDLVIEVAIVRPGPIQGDMVHPYLRRRQGLEPASYPSPELKAVLDKTLGVPLFQEQAMRIAIVAGGFTPGEADKLRRAMATFKRTGTIGTFKTKMIEGMVARNYPREFAERCFSQIEGFGEYGFPESHAASFALLVYASAWLKCRYPDVFAAALLNAQPMGFYAPAQIVRDLREHGVEVRPVDINHSDWDATLEPGSPPDDCVHDLHRTMLDDMRATHALRLGFRKIKGLSEDAGRVIVARRHQQSPYRSVRDLWLRTGLSPRIVERLADADAFGSLGLTRRQALWAAKALGRVGDRDDDLPLFHAGHMSQNESHQLAGTPLPIPPAAASGKLVDSERSHINTAAQNDSEIQSAGVPLAFPPPHCASQTRVNALVLGEGQGGGKPGNSAQVSSPSPPLPRKRGREPAVPSGDADALLSLEPDVQFLSSEPEVQLPPMGVGEEVVNDYRFLELTLRTHPASFLRADLARRRIICNAQLRTLCSGTRVTVSGLVTIRQQPGSAHGVIFMTIEDETAVANIIVWPKTFERFRPIVLGARYVAITGELQQESGVIHVVAGKLEDLTPLLARLTEDAPPIESLARADAVKRPHDENVDSRARGRRNPPRIAAPTELPDLLASDLDVPARGSAHTPSRRGGTKIAR